MTGLTVARFLLVGIANTAIGFAVVMWAHYGAGASPLVANVAGYLVGGLASYLLNRSFTFGSRRAHAVALPLFVATVLACFVLNAIVLQLALSTLHLPFPVAQAAAMIAYTGSSYLLNRFLVFPRSAAAHREP